MKKIGTATIFHTAGVFPRSFSTRKMGTDSIYGRAKRAVESCLSPIFLIALAVLLTNTALAEEPQGVLAPAELVKGRRAR